MKFKLLFFVSLVFMLVGCAILKNDKTITGIRIDYDENTPISYGQTFTFSTYAIYASGKEKDISSKNDLVVTVSGAEYNSRKVTLSEMPESPIIDTVYVQVSYTYNEQVFTQKKAIPYNYLCDLKINLPAVDGEQGEQGRDKATPLLFRNGNDGDEGGIGANGQDGHQLAVYIWKDLYKDLFRIKVNDLTSEKIYFFTFKNNGFGIRFNLNGGNGGKGGKGGDGGSGKDGVNNDKKSKEPGSGGNGGNGGTGGNGGNGGSAIIFLHPSAISLQKKFAIENSGGSGGLAGDAGKRGEPGKPAEGQKSADYGTEGQTGIAGSAGLMGDPIQLIIEEFDIEQ